LQEGLGGIRDVLLDNSQEFYCKLYRNADIPLRHASASNSFISTGPRYLIEAIGVSLIAGMAYLMSREASNVATVIPVLGVFAMGAQRLLPVLQQIYASISTLRGAKSSFNDVKELLEQPLPTNVFRPVLDNLEFKSRITLNEVCFRYSKETPWIINKINLTINKGDVVGFVGKTGSGKSTLIDIIMGLLQPSSGKLLVDDVLISPKILRNWQSLIAHVPQSVYLSDASVLENIAFGISKNDIDIKRVIFSAKKAHIFDFIQSLPKKFETVVGEQGVKLSGGQKQRIGIARALYKKSKVIVFDEATSALDIETERAITESIQKLEHTKTIIIVAHRLNTIKNCDEIFILKNGKIHDSGSYDDLLKKNNWFQSINNQGETH
jgi:ATP-binding cassette subfamily B protein